MTKLTLLKSESSNTVLEGIKMKRMHTTSKNKEPQKLSPDIEGLEPELLKNFMTYWLMRKTSSIKSVGALKEIKNSNTAQWLNLIESNHKFRNLYGEDIANALVELIEEDKN